MHLQQERSNYVEYHVGFMHNLFIETLPVQWTVLFGQKLDCLKIIFHFPRSVWPVGGLV